MRAIHRKLMRDLWQIKGQVVAIAAVIGVGVMLFIAYISTFDSLRGTQQAYYDRYRFAEVFASLERGPNHLGQEIAEIPGVSNVATRVVSDVTLDVPGMDEPITGRLVSVPERREGMLNDLVLRQGRHLDPTRQDEVVVIEGFALAHGLTPGSTLSALINGRQRELEVVGVALSPEFVYTIRPGALMPDHARYGVLWMNHRALATAFDMEGGFNDLALGLTRGASEQEVIARVDRLLEPYGGLGAYPRTLQTSHWYLDNELKQLEGMGFFVPSIFLSVAAFLLNIALTRIISVQREQIAALKALGYTNAEVGWHYTLWSLTVSGLGGALGTVLGYQLGQVYIQLYNEYFRFPFLAFEMSPRVIVGALLISLAAGLVGAWSSVRRAVSLPPAEAMRPEPPADFRRSFLERIGLARFLSQPARIVLRNLGRRPLRTLASVVGIAFSGGLLIIGFFLSDSIVELMDVQFNVIQRQDITVSFVQPRSRQAFHELTRLPGVTAVEAARNVPVRLRFEQHSRQTSITGVQDGADLQRVVDTAFESITLPSEGLVLSAKLAEILGASVGDTLFLEVLEGARPVREAVISALVDEYMGMSVYMHIDALRAMMREGSNLTGAYLAVDPGFQGVLYEHLKTLPAVAGVALTSAAVAAFNNQMEQMMGWFILFNILFASVITIGVVYNAARIALSERSHELASMRVLGYTRGEISAILLGELTLVTLAAIPLGWVFGYAQSAWMVSGFETELYRFPLVITPASYAWSALVVLLASILSGLLVRRKLDHLDLVEVLKTKE